jgi:hypothetical protein
MSDSELANYLDTLTSAAPGQPVKKGGLGWYDHDHGVAVIERVPGSLTSYKLSYAAFCRKLA